MWIRGLAALVALTGTCVVASIGAPVRAATPTAPPQAAVEWLSGRLQGDLVPGSSGGVDYDASADAILSLVGLGDHADLAASIAEALASDIDSYLSGGSTAGQTDAGAVAKAAVALATAGLDPTDVSGQDLITRLHDAVDDDSGRIHDTSAEGDHADVAGQAYAVLALNEAADGAWDSAADFLNTQQCAQGWFRSGFTVTSRDPRVQGDAACDDDAASSPSVEATATVLIALHPLWHNDAVETPVLRKAVAWLAGVRSTDGGFTADGTKDSAKNPANANSTALAALALGLYGRSFGAARAASWVRSVTLTNVGACAPFGSADAGAIAPSLAARATALGAGITPTTSDSFLRATAQGMASLAGAPSGPAPSPASLSSKYFAPGQKVTLKVLSGPQGASYCASFRKAHTLLVGHTTDDGGVKTTVTLPKKPGSFTASIGDGTTRATWKLRVLAPKRLHATIASAIRSSGKVTTTVRVEGLAAGEKARISLGSATLARGTANEHGVFSALVRIRHTPGVVTVVATGSYQARRGTVRVAVR